MAERRPGILPSPCGQSRLSPTPSLLTSKWGKAPEGDRLSPETVSAPEVEGGRCHSAAERKAGLCREMNGVACHRGEIGRVSQADQRLGAGDLLLIRTDAEVT